MRDWASYFLGAEDVVSLGPVTKKIKGLELDVVGRCGD